MELKSGKSIIAYWMLAFFVLLTIGSSGLIVAKRYQIKFSVHSMIKSLSEDELLPIEVSYVAGDEALEEFEVDGEMYDVASYKIVNDKIIYYCYYDSSESKLNILSAHWNQLQDIASMRSNLSHLLKIVDIKYISTYSDCEIACKTTSLSFAEEIDLIALIFTDISTPPPQQV